ncbi:MAG: PKD domain-containing protein [Patescibacteria group bacterium]|nr:PKD domain-containing protein [Patescibacteria group bacterium]
MYELFEHEQFSLQPSLIRSGNGVQLNEFDIEWYITDIEKKDNRFSDDEYEIELQLAEGNHNPFATLTHKIFDDWAFSCQTDKTIEIEESTIPLAHFIITNDKNNTTEDTVFFDAETSKKHPSEDLLYRWNFDNDTQWDTLWSEISTGSYIFPAAGNYTITLQTKNKEGETNIFQDDIRIKQAPSHLISNIQEVITETKLTGDFNIYHASNRQKTDQASTESILIFDASKTSIRGYNRKDIYIQWDFDGDGQWDTDPLPFNDNKTTQYQYTSPGMYWAQLKVFVQTTDDLENTEEMNAIHITQQSIEIVVSSDPQTNFWIDSLTGNIKSIFEFSIVEQEDMQTEQRNLQYRFDWE